MSDPSDAPVSLMNDTKWEELRNAMYALGDNSPRWRTLDVESGYLCDWDGEWFYHFQQGGYKAIEYVEIKVSSENMRRAVRRELAQIHVPGCETETGFVVVGYIETGKGIDYIQDL